MSGLKAFEGLHQAIAHLCLRDGRTRKDIADAAGINASMLSGYCSGRLSPSLENLDRLLTALGVALEDLASELRMVNHRRAPAPPSPLYGFPDHKDSDAASRMLRMLFKDLYQLMQAEQARALSSAPPEPEPPPPSSPPETAPRGRPRKPRRSG